jgi:hypothetical protein
MDEIKAMTPEERSEVAEFLRQLEGTSSVRYADDKLADEVADRILDRHADLMRKLAS